MGPFDVTGFMKNPAKLMFQRELHLREGRVIRTVADAIALLREHEARPGVDDRDEVLHRLERAHNEQEIRQATEAFVVWAKELDLLVPAVETARPRA
jgi:hypothetical protein